MLSRIEKLYTKDEMQNILSSFTQEKNVCVFTNTLKISIEELEKEFLKQKLKFKKINAYCYLFDTKDKAILSSMKVFNEAHFYILIFIYYLNCIL